MPRQLITDDFAVVLVIFDDKDTDGIRSTPKGGSSGRRRANDTGTESWIPLGPSICGASYLPMIRTRTHSVLTAQASAVTIR